MDAPDRSLEVRWWDPAPPLEHLRALPGLDYLRAMADGALPPPPVASLLGMRIESVDEGVVVFALDPHESHYNPLGVVHGGVLSTLLDTVLGCAVHTLLPAGWGYTSIDLNVSYLRAVRVGSGPLRFTGRVLKHGRRVSFATAEGVDASGATVVTGTSSLLVMAPEGA
jgi:uncharacterized domain 1